MRFSHQLRKAEGQRTPKVELTVSVDGVAIQEPKAKVSIIIIKGLLFLFYFILFYFILFTLHYITLFYFV